MLAGRGPSSCRCRRNLVATASPVAAHCSSSLPERCRLRAACFIPRPPLALPPESCAASPTDGDSPSSRPRIPPAKAESRPSVGVSPDIEIAADQAAAVAHEAALKHLAGTADGEEPEASCGWNLAGVRGELRSAAVEPPSCGSRWRLPSAADPLRERPALPPEGWPDQMEHDVPGPEADVGVDERLGTTCRRLRQGDLEDAARAATELRLLEGGLDRSRMRAYINGWVNAGSASTARPPACECPVRDPVVLFSLWGEPMSVSWAQCEPFRWRSWWRTCRTSSSRRSSASRPLSPGTGSPSFGWCQPTT